MEINFDNIRQAEGILDSLAELKEKIESRINLIEQVEDEKKVILTGNKIMRICLIVGLYQDGERNMDKVNEIQISRVSNRIYSSFFTFLDLRSMFSALLKLRYKDCNVDWTNNPTLSRIIAAEMYRGRDYLMSEYNLDSFLNSNVTSSSVSGRRGIPELDLLLGEYDADVPAYINMNGAGITNTQILVAGATGSGKTTLLRRLINQMRVLSTESAYPVNFLLFDYKGEFSDIQNNGWLSQFDVDRSCILDPVKKPLPFTPFKDFTGCPINEINLYSTEMATALCALDRANISANMSNRMSEAVLEAYKKTHGAPISFDMILKEYMALKQKDGDDSVSSVLKQIIRTNLFENEDKVKLEKESYIIKMNSFPKDGPVAKAIVYFVVSKLNNIYEQLTPQENDGKRVQLRHFTVIDEAHYMLDFDNRPLRNLIAVGRNKGMSIILATQNMESFKSKHFDFYANAQYPLIMKQQTINDAVIKDLFGVSGKEFQEIKSEISGLQKGELIIKDANAYLLDMGKKWKKIKVYPL